MANPDANGLLERSQTLRHAAAATSWPLQEVCAAKWITDAAGHRLPPVLSPQIEPRKIDEKPVLFVQGQLLESSKLLIIIHPGSRTLSFFVGAIHEHRMMAKALHDKALQTRMDGMTLRRVAA